MGNFARKIIDAVQNLLLDRLFLRVFPLWWVGSLWEERLGDQAPDFMGSMLFAVLLVFAIGWALGALANRRPPSTGRAFGRIQDPPSNGFGAWSELPAGGLNPPSWLRVAVVTLGGRPPPNPWMALVEVSLFLAACVLLWPLAHRPADFWVDVHPTLADGSVRDGLWLGAVVVVVLMVLRHWATEQCARLEPERETRDPITSEWFGFGLSSVVLVWMTLFAIGIFEWPIWIAAIVVLALVIVAFLPKWRTGLAEMLFGKRAEADNPRSDEASTN